MTSYVKGTDWGVYLIHRGITVRKCPLHIPPCLPHRPFFEVIKYGERLANFLWKRKSSKCLHICGYKACLCIMSIRGVCNFSYLPSGALYPRESYGKLHTP